MVLTKDKKRANFVWEKQLYPDHPERFQGCQVLCEQGLTGRHYWEVQCDSADVGVAYKRIKRTGDCSGEFSLGKNDNSWCWLDEGHFIHNSISVEHLTFSRSKIIGVYLDWPAGILTFFDTFDDTWTHLYTVCTTFTEPLHPGFSLMHGSIHLCEIK